MEHLSEIPERVSGCAQSGYCGLRGWQAVQALSQAQEDPGIGSLGELGDTQGAGDLWWDGSGGGVSGVPGREACQGDDGLKVSLSGVHVGNRRVIDFQYFVGWCDG